MPVTCPQCAAVVPVADVDLGTHLAKCRGCNEVFAFDAPAPPPAPVVGPMPPVPKGVTVTDDGVTRTLRFRWFTPAAFFLLFFCIAWDSFLVFWYSKAVGMGPKVPWLMVVFPIAHVAVGIGLTYYTLCLFVNRTLVTVDSALRVDHGPLFWSGQALLPADDITALYCEMQVSRGKGGPSVTYLVKAVTTDGREVTLLARLDTLPQAKFFERQLEAWLGLPPTAVAGEAS